MGIEEETGGVVKNLVGRSNSSGGGGGGKRPFSTFAGSNVVSPRSLPIKGNTMPSTLATLLPPATFFTATTTAKPFVHYPRTPRTIRMAAMGRFLTRLGKW